MKTWGVQILSLVVLILTGFVMGCGMRDPHFAILPKSQSFLTSGTLNNKVDILWVIKNSGTMGPKQQNLANNITSFMTQFVSKKMDYQIGVVTTDIRPIDPAHPTDPNYSGQGACLVGNPTIITPSTPNPVAALATNANVGYYGSADAHGLDAPRLALSSPNLTGCNAGFLRPDAFLAVIEFADTDDDTSATVGGLITFLGTIHPPMTSAGGAAIQSYFGSSMVVNDMSNPNCVALGPWSELGVKYMNFASLTGGTIASICDPNFSTGLLNVGTKILESSTAVALASVPDPTTIQVLENGGLINNDGNNGWTYNSSSNTIVFHGSALPVGAGVSITVNYTPADITR